MGYGFQGQGQNAIFANADVLSTGHVTLWAWNRFIDTSGERETVARCLARLKA